jgi:hypothetical protein
LRARLTYARDVRWGYLTASLGNVGTGLRLSLLVHLSALAFLGRLPDTLRAAQHLGISVRGAHGEHSLAAGDLYQVSNAVTFGLEPSHIAGRIRPVAEYLVSPSGRPAARSPTPTPRGSSRSPASPGRESSAPTGLPPVKPLICCRACAWPLPAVWFHWAATRPRPTLPCSPRSSPTCARAPA